MTLEKHIGDWIEKGTILEEALFHGMAFAAKLTAAQYGEPYKFDRFEFTPGTDDKANSILMAMVIVPGEPAATAESIMEAYATIPKLPG